MNKFVIKKTADGYKFDLEAANGQIIASSEVYPSEDACKSGIDAVKKFAPKAKVEDQSAPDYPILKHPKFQMYIDRDGDFRFALSARNGDIIATSSGYKTKAACDNGIEDVKENAPEAEVSVTE